MNTYEERIRDEVRLWKNKLVQKPKLVQRLAKQAQTKMNGMIPEKAHEIITESMKNFVQMTLTGSEITTWKNYPLHFTLEERDQLFDEKLSLYRKTAVAEGAGTGAAGLLLGLADFPLLLTIKMKFLYEAAAIYGFAAKEYEERIFMLQVFQLAFSGPEVRQETMGVIENWQERKATFADMDWREFQQEYRDHIDFVKMLQLVPGIGAVVGAIANYHLLDQLGECAKNCYRLRYLHEKAGIA